MAVNGRHERVPNWRLVLCAAPVAVIAAVAYGASGPRPGGPEGTEWILAEVGGTPVSIRPGERRPSLMLDGAQEKATGFSGCNSFFAKYQLDDARLRLGPIGATRRVCPEVDPTVETKFLEALARTRGWRIDDGELALLSGPEVLARLNRAQPDAAADLGSSTFHSTVLGGEPVTLVGGAYSGPAAPGSASRVTMTLSAMRAFGVVRGTESAAVVLAASTGGTGTFYELALCFRDAEQWVNTDTVLLGDRVKVHSVAMEGETVVVAMTTHAPSDPICCPTDEVTRRFRVDGARLTASSPEPVAQQPVLAGTVWRWVHTHHNDDRLVVPPKPESYVVRFLAGDQIEVKADCNLKSGTYTAQANHLSITLIQSTMAACEPGSLEDEFVKDLAACASFHFVDGDLFIDLKIDSGTIRLTPHGKEWDEGRKVR